ncbi:MAG: hypothetical protein R2761_24300 [Acidimicrobiales bacterium]
MKLLSRLVGRRASKLGLMSDVAMVGAAAYRVARHPPDGTKTRKKPTVVQWMLVAGAALRILGRVRQVRRNRRAGAVS